MPCVLILRGERCACENAARRRDLERFRVLQFSVQHDHIHLLVEAADKSALSSGMRSIAIRIALYVNELLNRRGVFWADRWHGRALRTPREVRNAFVYVLANFRKHMRVSRSGIDPYSSAAAFDGWRTASGLAPPLASPRLFPRDSEPVVSAARTWLARAGWRRHGLLRFDESPQPTRT